MWSERALDKGFDEELGVDLDVVTLPGGARDVDHPDDTQRASADARKDRDPCPWRRRRPVEHRSTS
jgi:hypothetical protein